MRAGAEPSVLEDTSVADDTPMFPVVSFRGYDRAIMLIPSWLSRVSAIF